MNDRYKLILKALVYLITRTTHKGYGYDNVGSALINEMRVALSLLETAPEEDANETT